MSENRSPDERASPNTDILRAAIDAGRTRDKVAGPDPAAAPLGTDDEAGGAPASPAEVEIALRNEAGRAASEPERTGLNKVWPWLLAVLVVIAIFALLLAISV
ncbi:hypothetical protein [Rhodoligotrophos defluvii]|uniref:hypothetical protein n=1 Tax=Rhodoligotrophos defluvii TaxID=2561934 RepID=UPI0010CA1497|nr:hypothetical protein [Rhodoligotrophos defluvii]